MKTRIFNKIAMRLVVLAGINVVAASCSDDFLKQDPLSFYEPGKTFQTESGLAAALAMNDKLLLNMYLHYSGGANNIPITTEYMFSEMNLWGMTDVGAGRMQDDFAKKLTPTTFIIDSNQGDNAIGYFWNQGFSGIKFANTVLSYIDGVSGLPEATKNIYKGRAYFHRAWHYSHLVFQFGDLPLVTKILEVPKQNYRSTKMSAILDMLVSDMEKAVQWVPEQKDMEYYGMVNKGGCRMLLAKLYLATGRFKKAELQADTLINQSGYQLMTENFGTFENSGSQTTRPITRNVIWDLHRPQNKIIQANKELIMGMSNKGESKQGQIDAQILRIFVPFWNGKIQSPSGSNNNTAINRYAKTNKKYDEALDWVRYTGRGIGTSRPTYFAQHTLWEVNNVEDNSDLRHNHEVGNWMRMTDFKYNNPDDKLATEEVGEWYGKNIRLYDDNGKQLCQDTIRCWYDYPYYKLFIKDTKNEAVETANDFVQTSGSDASLYLYRLAEAYLLRAEARFFQDKITEATEDVNAIRRRAKCSQFYTTVNIGDIMNERARELYLEEWRNCELKRVSYQLAQTGKPDEWGNTYSLDTWNKQEGTDAQGGSYWYQRIYHYSFYNHGEINAGTAKLNYTMDKKNMFWPIPQAVINANNKGQLHQNYGYTGYDGNAPEWDNWQDAVADEDKTN